MKLFWKLKQDNLVFGRKRKETTKSILASILSIFLALIVALLVAAAMGYDPFSVFTTLFSVGFSDPIYLFYKFGVFALAGLAFCFAMKAGIINIGISGQMMAAGTVIVVITKNLEFIQMPVVLGQLFVLIIGILVGSMVAMTVGLLESYLKVNSVVSAILLNWIIYFVAFFILATYFTEGEQFANSVFVPDQFRLYDVNNGTGGIIPIVVICATLAIVMFVVFKFTVFGHRIKSIGLSPTASKFAGYNIRALKLSTFAISGGIAGILACVCYTASAVPAIPLSLFVDAVPVEGFKGIMIALVGFNNPFGIILVSLLFGLFDSSAQGLVTPPTFNDVIIGFVMLGSAMTVLVLKWQPWVKLKSWKYDINYSNTQLQVDNSLDSLVSKYHSIKNALKADRKLEIKQVKENYKDIQSTSHINDDHIYENNLREKIEIIHNNYHQQLSEVTNNYQIEKNKILEQYKYNEILNLIYSRILTKDIIADKQQMIDNKYDAYLTKHLSKIRNKKSKNEVIQTQICITKSSSWKRLKLLKMTNWQNRFINNQDKFDIEIKRIKQKIDKLTSLDNKQKLDELVQSAKVLESKNLVMMEGEQNNG